MYLLKVPSDAMKEMEDTVLDLDELRRWKISGENITILSLRYNNLDKSLKVILFNFKQGYYRNRM